MACWPNPPIELGDIDLPAGGDAGAEARLTGRWTFLYLHQGDCGPPCEDALVLMRQVRLALGKDASRVQRVFVPEAAQLNRGQVGAGVSRHGRSPRGNAGTHAN